MVGLCYVPSIDTAFYGAAGCVMRSGSREPILDCGAAIERLFCARDTFYFQPSSGVVGRYGPGNALEYISAVADSAFAYGELEPGEFVSPGSIYRWVNYVAAPDDPVDGVDRDCDGLDD